MIYFVVTYFQVTADNRNLSNQRLIKEVICLNTVSESKLKLGRTMYILEAAFEYLISLLVTGSFLATLTKELGLSDSLTGILSSVISLGCLFQLLSVAFHKRQVKRFVIALSIANQLLFLFLYAVPLLEIDKTVKTAIFIVFIFTAYLIYNFAHPKKISWLMSLVDNSHRGRFTADKEIFSLITGMIFSFSMGALIDYYKEKDEIRTAFILSATVIFTLMVLHTLTMVLTVEKPNEILRKKNIFKNISDVCKNKNVVKTAALNVIYHIAYYMATPFFGTYQISELGFSLKMVSVFTIVSSVVRIFVSRFWGTYSDKKSFAQTLEKCMVILAAGFAFVIVANPSNGKIMFAFYYVLSGIAFGGLNSALMNMIFDYSSYEMRADSLAVCQAVSGVTGFLTTLAVSPLVSHIQSNSNRIFGMNVYAQQVVTAFGLVFLVVAILFVRLVIINKGKVVK